MVGEDGSVRREMRFRTPNSEHHQPQPQATKRPTARVSPNVKVTSTSSASPGNHPTSSSESRGQPDGAAAAPEVANNTPSKPPPSTHRRTTQSGGGASPRYASPTQSSSRRGVGVGASSGSASSVTVGPASRSPVASPASRTTTSSIPNASNVRVQPTQRGGGGPTSSRPRVGASRRRSSHQSNSSAGPSASDIPQPMQLIQCPLCSRSFEKHVIELHAANCEGKPEDVPEVVTIPDDDLPTPSSRSRQENSKVDCPICDQAYDQSEIEAHAANCGEEVYV